MNLDLIFISGAKTAINAASLEELKGFCSRQQLTVVNTGRHGRAIKADYLRSILQQVSSQLLFSTRAYCLITC